jgi:hypothetical protein
VLEYPLALVALCLLQCSPAGTGGTALRRWLDFILPALLAVVFGAAMFALHRAGLQESLLLLDLCLAAAAVFCFSFSRRPLRFSLGIAAMLLAGALFPAELGTTLRAERNFFGLVRVSEFKATSGMRYHMLEHSGTVHGLQSLDPAYRDRPLTYYYPTGPIGQLFASLGAQPSVRNVGVVGLGAGSLGCYRRPGQEWTFYEIDPAIARLAEDPRYFSFLHDCSPGAQIVLGDARLSLAKATPAGYDLLVLDAYSSDTVPVHLVTREALALYLSKLEPDGVLAFHISNRYLDLKPVLGNLARNAGLTALVQEDLQVSAEDAALGKTPSVWVVMARSGDALGPLAADGRWLPLAPRPDQQLWSDDFSSITSIFHWH